MTAKPASAGFLATETGQSHFSIIFGIETETDVTLTQAFAEWTARITDFVIAKKINGKRKLDQIAEI